MKMMGTRLKTKDFDKISIGDIAEEWAIYGAAKEWVQSPKRDAGPENRRNYRKDRQANAALLEPIRSLG